jgi:hypothetical protein
VRHSKTKVTRFVLLAILFWLVPRVSAQTEDDMAYKAERDKAISLFGENKYLEALPLFEDLFA